jgi:LmbE family N-acetylglucosaminyl deacetylase/glycosyltransferase involved in cell wall biosynthesis
MNDPRPPGFTEDVHAESVLVVAPHYDDEVLGCGGLLVRLAAAGAAVRVLFLTDSGHTEDGGEGEADERAAYHRRRRREAAEAAEVLGLAGADHLELPDGELHRHLEAAERGIRRAVLSQRPDLLLVPSPLEVTPDHRAAFHALHRVLAPVREGSTANPSADSATESEAAALREATASCRVLVYEINQPAYPDLLVDVSSQVPRLEEAMARYRSQQERHDYLAAALGLRRFRTLTLPATSRGPETGAEPPADDGTGRRREPAGDSRQRSATAVEGYRSLSVSDFATRSPAQLVRHLGGSPELTEVTEGPSVSVVVRTKDRPELLAQALGSLAEGTYRRVQVVLVNDGGETPRIPDGYPFPVERIDLPDNRGRAEAANAGVAAATGDYITFLDDDDLAAPEHLATLADASAGTGVRVVYTDAAVALYELAGGDGTAKETETGREDGAGSSGWVCRERRLPYSRDFDPERLLLDNYIPFNTLLIERALFDEASAGETPFDPDLPFFEDWDFLIRLSRRATFHHLPRVTCEYRHFRGGGHHVLGERPRQRADFLAMKARVLAKHASFLEPGLLARAVDALKTEMVEAREEARSSSEARRRKERQLHALESDYHRINGELHGLRGDVVHKARELERLYEEERKLRAVVQDQDEHLKRMYSEIERLQGVIREMESTRVWRIHRRLTGGRRRGS